MLEKKDPGKFTVRFNIADPQQRTVIQLLNEQGRYKAQFLTSAVLHYVHCTKTSDIHGIPTMTSEEIERIVRNILSEQQRIDPPQEIAASDSLPKESGSTLPTIDSTDLLGDADKEAIFQTMSAFHKK